jgi:hypothetical protein
MPRSSHSSRRPAQALRRHRTDAALALDRLDQDRADLRPQRRREGVVVAERHLVEAVHLGPKPSRYFACPPAAMVARVRPWKAPRR